MKKIQDQKLHKKKSKTEIDREADIRIAVVAYARSRTLRKDYISDKDMAKFIDSL